MSYSSTNPPTVVSQRIAGGPAVLTYMSSDLVGTAAASSYFSNGAALGLRVGDIMHVSVLGATGNFVGHNTCRVNVVTSGAGATITCATSST